MQRRQPILLVAVVLVLTAGCLTFTENRDPTDEFQGDPGHVSIDRYDRGSKGPIAAEDIVVDYYDSPWVTLPGADRAFETAHQNGSGSIPLNDSTAERLAGLLNAWKPNPSNGTTYVRYRDNRYNVTWMVDGSRHVPSHDHRLPPDAIVAYRSGDVLVVKYHVADRDIVPPTEATIVTIAGNDSSRHYCPRKQRGTLRIPMNEVFPDGSIVELYEDDRWIPATTPCYDIGGMGATDSIAGTNWGPSTSSHDRDTTESSRSPDRGSGAEDHQSDDTAEPADERVIVRSDRNATLDLTLTRNDTTELESSIPIHAGGQVVTNITQPGRYRLSVTLDDRTATRNVTVTSEQLGDCNRGTIAIVVFEEILEIQREQELARCAP